MNIENPQAAWAYRFRKWLRFGHAPAGPCSKCPYPHLPHNHARNEQGRSGFY